MTHLDLEAMTLAELRQYRLDIDLQIAAAEFGQALVALGQAHGYRAEFRGLRPAGASVVFWRIDAPADPAPADPAPADPGADPAEGVCPAPAAAPARQAAARPNAWEPREDAKAIEWLARGATLKDVAIGLGRPLEGTKKRAQVARWRERAALAAGGGSPADAAPEVPAEPAAEVLAEPAPAPAFTEGAAFEPFEVGHLAGHLAALEVCPDDRLIVGLGLKGWSVFAIAKALEWRPGAVADRARALREKGRGGARGQYPDDRLYAALCAAFPPAAEDPDFDFCRKMARRAASQGST